MYINSLPNDLWSQSILQFISTKERLESLTLVSSHFQSLVYHSIHSLSLHSDDRTLSAKEIVHRLPCINTIHVSFCDTFNDLTLMKIGHQQSQLRSLTLTHCPNITDISPIYNLYNLQHLEINQCRNISTTGSASNTTMSLRSLKITNCSAALDTAVIEDLILRSSGTLSSVKVERMNHIFSFHIPYCRYIQSISFRRCGNLSSLRVLSQDSENDTIVSIDLGYTSVTDTSLSQLFASCKFNKLASVQADGCKNLLEPTVSLPSVQSITFDFCSNLRKLRFENCRMLTTLSVSYTHINDHAFELISREVPSLKKLEAKNCKDLKRPKLICYDMYSTCGKSQLQDLDMQSCSNLTSLQLNCTTSPLKRVSLNWTKISDPIVEHIVRNCPDLTDLELKTCDNIVSPRIIHSNIESIDLSGNHSLLSPVIKCDNLQRVEMVNCYNVESDDALVIESKVPVTPTRKRTVSKVDQLSPSISPRSPPGSNRSRTPPSEPSEQQTTPTTTARRRLVF